MLLEFIFIFYALCIISSLFAALQLAKVPIEPKTIFAIHSIYLAKFTTFGHFINKL